MFHKFLSFFGRDDLTEENVIKQIHDCIYMLFRSDYFAKRYIGVEVFQKRQDLKKSFIEYIENEMKRIIASDNPHREFRQKIIKTIKIQSINSILLKEEFQYSRDKICESINRFIETSEDNEIFRKGMMLVKDAEMFADQPWDYTKLTYETTWAEVEGLVLRHLQIMVFESVNKDSDWWDIYRQAYENYVIDFYRLMLSKDDLSEGFPHPMLAAMSNESLIHMEDLIIDKASK
jgi:hypothetical protein